MDQYQVTGNEYVSLPAIRETDGIVESISCLYMQLKGMLELKGRNGLICPFVKSREAEKRLNPLWKRDHYWIPSFQSKDTDILFQCTYLAPIGERGFGLRLHAENITDECHEITIGVRGSWDETMHTVNESIPLQTGRSVLCSNWNHMFVFQQVPGTPLIAFAPIAEDDQPFSEYHQGAEWKQNDFSYSIQKTSVLKPGEEMHLDIFFGIGYEEVAAAASAKEMLRQGFDALKARTDHWLLMREKQIGDPGLRLLLNTNLFFTFFYASGRTVDTEELCMMTSRSPRYYVSAAYWDRDSLLWAFPAIVEADPGYAKELLVSVFNRQSRNFGIHSRYIDGTVLEPGFELDELCAPVIAVDRYIRKTGDRGILQHREIREALECVPEKLENRKHPDVDLYGTFLQPTDDMHNFPYLTYDNVLVWKSLTVLSEMLSIPKLKEKAERVRTAIIQHCVQEYKGNRIFAWSVDLNGNWDIYDEPPGSIQLFPFYGFCDFDDPVWNNTVSLIRDSDYSLSFAGHPVAEIGCKHAPHPWILSICNSLLSNHTESALSHLMKTKMDNGIACESVHEDSGECTTGSAFATCAGFLSFALCHALLADGGGQ